MTIIARTSEGVGFKALDIPGREACPRGEGNDLSPSPFPAEMAKDDGKAAGTGIPLSITAQKKGSLRSLYHAGPAGPLTL